MRVPLNPISLHYVTHSLTQRLRTLQLLSCLRVEIIFKMDFSNNAFLENVPKLT